MSKNFDEKVFGVLDEKLGSYRFKFFCGTEKAAEREFGDSVNNPKSVFASHPEDFSLYCLGTFDTDSGFLQAVIPPQFLGRAVDYVQLTGQLPHTLQSSNGSTGGV